MSVALWIISLMIKLTTSQFPVHLDLQKVDEIMFKNEKYNVLRLTEHTMKDYFQEYMLRTDTSDLPTKKVLLDDNGFRHYWKGLEGLKAQRRCDNDKTVQEVKSEVKESEVDKDSEVTTTKNVETAEVEAIEIVENEMKATEVAKYVQTPKPIKRSKKRKNSERNGKKSKNTERKLTVEHYAPALDTAKANVRGGSKKIEQKGLGNAAGGGGKKMILVKTTMFCPYLGIVTTHNYVDA